MVSKSVRYRSALPGRFGIWLFVPLSHVMTPPDAIRQETREAPEAFPGLMSDFRFDPLAMRAGFDRREIAVDGR